EMRRRCRASGRDNSQYYSERGVTVCDEWSEFETFLADMGERPTPWHSIDRIDPNGSYEAGNCRWVTATEQNNNKRSNRWVTYRGMNVSLRTALRMAGDIVEKSTARLRLNRGWQIDAVVETPPDERHDKRRAARVRRKDDG